MEWVDTSFLFSFFYTCLLVFIWYYQMISRDFKISNILPWVRLVLLKYFRKLFNNSTIMNSTLNVSEFVKDCFPYQVIPLHRQTAYLSYACVWKVRAWPFMAGLTALTHNSLCKVNWCLNGSRVYSETYMNELVRGLWLPYFTAEKGEAKKKSEKETAVDVKSKGIILSLLPPIAFRDSVHRRSWCIHMQLRSRYSYLSTCRLSI